MVVLLIMGIILALASLTLGGNAQTRVRDEATRMAMLIQTAQEEAILQGTVIAVALDNEGYGFLGIGADGTMQPLQGDDALKPRSLEAGIRISRVEIAGVPERKQPLIILFPTGELTAFVLTLELDDVSWSVRGSADGDIQTLADPELADNELAMP